MPDGKYPDLRRYLMFYQMITNARNRWLASPECTVINLIAYIEHAGQMRDAQIDAIKTYLFLKT